MCNAYNHAYDCPCGFGGDTGGGGWRRGRIRSIAEMLEPISGGWAKDYGGTVESYVNANAHCPVCGESVFFIDPHTMVACSLTRLGGPGQSTRVPTTRLNREELREILSQITSSRLIRHGVRRAGSRFCVANFIGISRER